MYIFNYHYNSSGSNNSNNESQYINFVLYALYYDLLPYLYQINMFIYKSYYFGFLKKYIYVFKMTNKINK